jgi:hypothetical protein
MKRSASSRDSNKASAEEVLADAEDLVSSARHLDAIRYLTEANRVRRDRRLERRLVELRFEAFTNGSSSPASLPEQAEDCFPGEAIPEVHGNDLTVERLRSAIQNHGSILVRGLVSQEHCDRLVDDIDGAFAAFDAKANGEDDPKLDGWYMPIKMHHVNDEIRAEKRRTGSILAVESPPTLFDLVEIFNEEGIGQLARDYLGEAPALLARKVTLRRMDHNASGAWHQDGAFMGVDLRALNVWLALSHCGDTAPGLDVVGRRLDFIVPPGGASKPYACSPEAAERVAAGAIVRPIFEVGDALIFDHMLLHRTGKGVNMTNGRYAIETWLMAPSSYAAMTTPVEAGFQPDDQVPLVF